MVPFCPSLLGVFPQTSGESPMGCCEFHPKFVYFKHTHTYKRAQRESPKPIKYRFIIELQYSLCGHEAFHNVVLRWQSIFLSFPFSFLVGGQLLNFLLWVSLLGFNFALCFFRSFSRGLLLLLLLFFFLAITKKFKG